MSCRIRQIPINVRNPEKIITILKSSPEEALQSKALAVYEVNPEKGSLCQLVMRLTNQLLPSTPPSPLLTPNRIKVITTETKNSYLEHWGKETKTQNKCYRGLNRNYEMAEYLHIVKDIKQRQLLTKYRMSDHTLAIEKARQKNMVT